MHIMTVLTKTADTSENTVPRNIDGAATQMESSNTVLDRGAAMAFSEFVDQTEVETGEIEYEVLEEYVPVLEDDTPQTDIEGGNFTEDLSEDDAGEGRRTTEIVIAPEVATENEIGIVQSGAVPEKPSVRNAPASDGSGQKLIAETVAPSLHSPRAGAAEASIRATMVVASEQQQETSFAPVLKQFSSPKTVQPKPQGETLDSAPEAHNDVRSPKKLASEMTEATAAGSNTNEKVEPMRFDQPMARRSSAEDKKDAKRDRVENTERAPARDQQIAYDFQRLHPKTPTQSMTLPQPSAALLPGATHFQMTDEPAVLLTEIDGVSETLFAAHSRGVVPLQSIVARAEMPVHVARQLAEGLQTSANKPVEISLSPAELGRVQMSMTTEDGAIVIHILAERHETLDLMRRNIDQLGQEFQALGYDQIAFSFGEGRAETDDDAEGQSDNEPHRLAANASEGHETLAAPIMAATRGIDIRL